MPYNAKLKLGSQVLDLTSMTEEDIAKAQGAIDLSLSNANAIALLQTAVAESNQKQHIIAATDLGATGATISGLTPGVLYDCYYNASNRYLTYDKTTGAFTDETVTGGDTPDIIPVQVKVFPALTESTVAAPRVYELTSSFAGFLKTTGAQTVDGVKTFNDTPQITATQDIATLGDNAAVKGTVVKAINTRVGTAEADIVALKASNTSKLSATIANSEPDDNDLTEGVLTLYPSQNRLTSGSSSGTESGSGESSGSGE